MINIELIYALPQEQDIITLNVAEGATVGDAIQLSGLLERYSEIDLNKNKVGIFSKPAKLEQTLREGDRIEIYRPLIADPKQARRNRAEKLKQTKK